MCISGISLALVPYLFAGYDSVSTIVMSSMPSNVAAHATATSAPDHPVWYHLPLTPTHNLKSAPETNPLGKLSQGARDLVKLRLLQRTPNLPLLQNIPPHMHLLLKILPSLSKWTWIKLHTRTPQPKRQIRLHQAIPRVCFVKSHHATQLRTQMV